ncbi:putative keratin-associated protein 4-4 [Cotonvirus japonicus]|uniref:Keratin-associated protein 4-4 n=1 Tax=Cotonvirus japonicus TaxID=2811091 RepID=A0ABM7NR33_9VIRU|nr:putative keratin-associated protein 4-4 [Cotonvirus japonicus]BCS82556.1 putative keratin-associated protein 4-4 [Cotonvirus japonicus]
MVNNCGCSDCVKVIRRTTICCPKTPECPRRCEPRRCCDDCDSVFISCREKCDPCCKPKCCEPCKPKCCEPCCKPLCCEPCKPKCCEPCCKPVCCEPCCKPVCCEPCKPKCYTITIKLNSC